MISALRTPANARGVLLALALLGLILRVAVPPGTMVAQTPTGFGPLVLCTGHGPITLASTDGSTAPEKAPAGKSGHDTPCMFSGVFAAPLVSHAIPVAAQYAAYEAPAAPQARGLIPGRGLAAPPLPARGPPALLI